MKQPARKYGIKQMARSLTLFVLQEQVAPLPAQPMYLKEKNPNIQIWAIDVYGSLLTKYFRTGEIDMNEVILISVKDLGKTLFRRIMI